MKQNQISSLPKLTLENMESIFNVYTDADGMYYYNLLQTIAFPTNLPPTFFKSYTVEFQDTWPYISYKAYKTPNLWWMILLANNIQDPTAEIVQGTNIRIPTIDVVREILSQINQQ
jgi:hypothetical protein